MATLAGFFSAPPAKAAILAPNPLSPLTLAAANSLKAVRDLLTAVQASQATITEVQENIQAEIQEIVENGQADPTTIAPAIQALVTSQVGTLATPVLFLALELASKVAAPVCPIVGAIAANTALDVPTMPDYSIFGPLAVPVRQIDQGVDDALYNFYVDAIARLLLPVDVGPLPIAPYISLAQGLLGLLKIDWQTTYYPPGGGVPLVRHTPAFLNLPMVLNVDGNVGIDVCGNMGLDLTTLTINQQIDRVPLANPTMSADIRSSFLGIINSGIETKGSFIPSMFQTITSTQQNPADTKVRRPGPTLTQLAGFALNTNTTSATTGIRTKLDLELFNRIRSVNTPEAYYVKSAAGLNSWWANAASTAFTNLTQSTGQAQLFFPASSTTPLATVPLESTSGYGATPAPAYLEYCTAANGSCSNAPAAQKSVETTSMHVKASQIVKVDTYSLTTSQLTPPITACPADTHIKTNNFTFGAKLPTASSLAGHAWLDTDNFAMAADSCIGATATLPKDLKAQDRLSFWTGTGNPPAQSKAGTITCPPGTSIKSSTAGSAVLYGEYLCPRPPANTVLPSIPGSPYVSFPITANPGTFTPSAPNAPTLSYQWQQCNSLGALCVNATGAGATTATYTPANGDLNKTLRVVVTATNLDGSAVATSPASAIVTLPAAPFASENPQISGSTSAPFIVNRFYNGSWGGFPTHFTYQWQVCDDTTGNTCTDIGGATDTTYAPTVGQQGKEVRIVVTGYNAGGTGTASSNFVHVPVAPTNTAPPIVKNGTSDATGQAVNAGDQLSVTDGTWTDVATFTYQWLSCDVVMPTMEMDCTAIPGATTNSYTATNDDVGHRLTAVVRGSNANGMLAKLASPTGLVVANAFIEKPVVDVPDGPVAATEASDHETTYIGGEFDTVGKINGQAGAFALNAASTPTGTPTVDALATQTNGKVLTVVNDGSDGYFFGGNFTTARGEPCVGVGHVLSTGAFDNSYCNLVTSGEVRAIARSTAGTALIAIGGDFVSGARNNLLWVDPAAATPRTPLFATDGDPNGPVNTIAISTSGNGFYYGGKFTQIGADVRGSLGFTIATAGAPPTLARAALNTTTGWSAAVCKTATAGGACLTSLADAATVKQILFNGVFGIFIVGDFNAHYRIGAAPAFYNNAVNASAAGSASTNGTARPWSPNTDGPINAIAFGAVPPSGAPGNTGPYTIYLGGNFTRIGGSVANGDPITSYTGGTAVTNLAEHAITLTSPTLGNAPVGTANNSSPSTTFTPALDGEVTSLVLGVADCNSGATCNPLASLYVGGRFTHVDGQERNRLALFQARQYNTATAAVLDATFAPAAGANVNAMTRNGTNLIVGGDFKVLGGVVRGRVAEIGSNGTVQPWKPVGLRFGRVNALARIGSTLYAGGFFSSAGNGASRNSLAAFDTTSGALEPWNPNSNGLVSALEPDGTGGLYAGGSFTTIGGQPRNKLAQISAAGSPTGWIADVDNSVRAIAVHGGNVYVAGLFLNAGATPRTRLAAFNAATAVLTAWDPNPNNTVASLEANADGVYIGGSFSNVGGAARDNLALVDGVTGVAVLSYDPSPNNTVRALKLAGTRLIVAGPFTLIGGQSRIGGAQLEPNGTPTAFNPMLSGGAANAISYSAGGLLGFGGDFIFVGSGPTQTNGIAQFGA